MQKHEENHRNNEDRFTLKTNPGVLAILMKQETGKQIGVETCSSSTTKDMRWMIQMRISMGKRESTWISPIWPATYVENVSGCSWRSQASETKRIPVPESHNTLSKKWVSRTWKPVITHNLTATRLQNRRTRATSEINECVFSWVIVTDARTLPGYYTSSTNSDYH